MSADSRHVHTIRSVEPGSIAEELGLEPGDRLISVNGQEPDDIFDYHYLINEEYLTVQILRADGEEWELEIEKEYEDDLGITFEQALMSEYRRCCNHCIFCFIDQMPPGMRPTLYFKDDDSRLSFLQGNYVTLTNMDDHDIERIIRYHMEPINVSIHTTDPDLRRKMLGNRHAGTALEKMKRLAQAGVMMNGQIVLCRDINDQEALDRTCRDLEDYLPSLRSVSVVPVGLTRFREKLSDLKAFDAASAASVLDQIGGWQDYYLKKHGTRLIHASDEWYILSGRPIPPADRYEGYRQLENGVGMVRLLIDEVHETLEAMRGQPGPEGGRRVTIATGRLAAGYVRELLYEISGQWPQLQGRVQEIRNDFFGEMITVSGLVTGQDLIAQLKDQDLGDELLLPLNMLRSGESVFLDDRTVDEVSRTLQTPVRIVESSGQSLVRAVLGLPDQDRK